MASCVAMRDLFDDLPYVCLFCSGLCAIDSEYVNTSLPCRFDSSDHVFIFSMVWGALRLGNRGRPRASFRNSWKWRGRGESSVSASV